MKLNIFFRLEKAWFGARQKLVSSLNYVFCFGENVILHYGKQNEKPTHAKLGISVSETIFWVSQTQQIQPWLLISGLWLTDSPPFHDKKFALIIYNAQQILIINHKDICTKHLPWLGQDLEQCCLFLLLPVLVPIILV